MHQNNTKTPAPQSAEHRGIVMFVTYILSKIRAYRQYRETVRELSMLSDHELADLGVGRFEIAAVARRAVFR